VALSECGGDASAPGLGLVPRRIDRVLPTWTGAISPMGVGPSGLAEALQGRPPLHPAFGPGDALLFDELFLHSTGGTPGMTRDRYALETWFFTPSTLPANYVPLAV
jgi:hypothetical protein